MTSKMTYAIVRTDANGRTNRTELRATKENAVWKEYVEATPLEGGALRRVELWRDDVLLFTTRYELSHTPDAYRIRNGSWTPNHSATRVAS